MNDLTLTRRNFVAGIAAAGLACGFGRVALAEEALDADNGAKGDATATGDEPETSKIVWARANSGNIFVTLAQKNGYFTEYGLEVEEKAVDSTTDALTALGNGAVDVTSNNGTNNPLSQIAAGQDFTMVAGYMLKGMYIVAKAGTGWSGVADLVGKKFAGPASQTAITGALLEAGYDPINDVEWLTYSTNSDRLSAVVAGEADYAVLSGDLLFTVGNMSDLEIVAWLEDLTPNYGCCRMNMRTQFVNDNPNTVKLLLKALLKSECYLNANEDECVTILANELSTPEEYVAAYLKNENYVPSVDPVRNSILHTWDVMVATSFVEEEAATTIDIDADHINTALYKQALDELVEESKGSDDEAFYADRVEFFEANNLKAYPFDDTPESVLSQA